MRTDFDDTALAAWWDRAYVSDNLIRNTFFQSRHWNQTWSECFVASDPRRELALLRIERAGAIVAAVPLFLQRRAVGPLTVWRYFLWIADRLAQYPDMVTTERDTAPLWDAVIRFLAAEYPDAWMQLRDVLPGSTAMPLATSTRCSDGDIFLRLVLSGEDEDRYLDRCTPHMRREIARARKQLAIGSPLRWFAARNPAPTLVERLVELNRQRFGAASWFADADNAEFFHTICARAGGEVLFSVVECERVPVHIMASYLHGGTVHYVLSGMDVRYRKHSPGSMNIDATIRWALREGYAYFDFLRGDEAYKREFSPEQRNSMHLEIPLSGRSIRNSIARAAQRLRQSADTARERGR